MDIHFPGVFKFSNCQTINLYIYYQRGIFPLKTFLCGLIVNFIYGEENPLQLQKDVIYFGSRKFGRSIEIGTRVHIQTVNNRSDLTKYYFWISRGKRPGEKDVLKDLLDHYEGTTTTKGLYLDHPQIPSPYTSDGPLSGFLWKPKPHLFPLHSLSVTFSSSKKCLEITWTEVVYCHLGTFIRFLGLVS